MVVPERVREQVKKSFEETPFDTEGLSEEEIRSEVEKRVVATKVEEM